MYHVFFINIFTVIHVHKRLLCIIIFLRQRHYQAEIKFLMKVVRK